MWISKKKWNDLEKRVADLEKQIQSQPLIDSNGEGNESIPTVNLTPTKIADGYAECDVRLVAGQKK